MEETTMSTAFKEAALSAQESATDLAAEATRQVRQAAPRVERAVRQGYGEVAAAAETITEGRALPALLAAATVGLLIAFFLRRR